MSAQMSDRVRITPFYGVEKWLKEGPIKQNEIAIFIAMSHYKNDLEEAKRLAYLFHLKTDGDIDLKDKIVGVEALARHLCKRIDGLSPDASMKAAVSLINGSSRTRCLNHHLNFMGDSLERISYSLDRD